MSIGVLQVFHDDLFMNERDILEGQKWLVRNEMPLMGRLKFISIETNPKPHINSSNIVVRDQIFDEVLNGAIKPHALKDALNTDDVQDILISEIDRYGLPHRTVLNLRSGLVRTDPYYDPEWLNRFYTKYYRDLYSNFKQTNIQDFFIAQLNKGNSYFKYLIPLIQADAKVLEIGCGMGGVLLPFKLNGFNVKGIDLGLEFITIGNLAGLNLVNEDVDAVIEKNEKYDLVILSHLIEHIVDVHLFLEKVKRVLTENGRVFIVVPGIRTISTTYKNNLHTYLQNAHCWSFTEKTLCALLVKCGFKIFLSNENVFCLAGVGQPELSYDLRNEAIDILSYLKRVEGIYLSGRRNDKPSLLKRGIKYIKRKIFY
jgi:2-polyprenyl-3-methyl-5-hydroxy-6-metoxy-1,4-benzoquinol methylase